MTSPSPLYAFFGHHKCGTTWIEDVCAQSIRPTKLRIGTVYDHSDFSGDLKNFVNENQIDFLIYANADCQYVHELRDYLGFHVVRDPRDVIVSAYFSHLHSHPTHAWPELELHRMSLQKASLDEGLLLEMEFSRSVLEQMEAWNLGDDRILEIRFEDLISNQYEVFLRIFQHLNLLDESRFALKKQARFVAMGVIRHIERLPYLAFPWKIEKIPAERLLGVVWENSFKKKSGGRRQGEEKKSSHYRKGIAGDWRNYFNAVHIDTFKSMYNPLLRKYGYETSDAW